MKAYWLILILLLLECTYLHSQLYHWNEANASNIIYSEFISVSKKTPINSNLLQKMNFHDDPVLEISNVSKAELSLGIGFLDFVNLGFKYGERVAAGVDICFVDLFGMVGYDEPRWKFLTISPSIYYHFGGKSLYSNQKPWYLRSGITFLNARPIERYVLFSARIGRKLFFDERFFKNRVGRVGLNIDVGINTFLWSNYEDSWDLSEFLKTIPGAGISFFYKL